jgi:hypothetical protein
MSYLTHCDTCKFIIEMDEQLVPNKTESNTESGHGNSLHNTQPIGQEADTFGAHKTGSDVWVNTVKRRL